MEDRTPSSVTDALETVTPVRAEPRTGRRGMEALVLALLLAGGGRSAVAEEATDCDEDCRARQRHAVVTRHQASTESHGVDGSSDGTLTA